MNYTLPNPVGLDYWVQGLQTGLYNRLCNVWGLDETTYNCFGRAYRNNVQDGYIPEFYNPDAAKYVNSLGSSTRGGMFFEDTKAAISFFHLSDPIKGKGGVWNVNAQLLFFVDLSRITPSQMTTEQQAGQRLDEVAVNDVRNYIQSNGYNWTLGNDYRDVDKVLERFTGVAKKNTLTKDMHPRFCFRLDLNLNYNPLLNRINSTIPQYMPQLIPQSLRLRIVASPDNTALIQVGVDKYIQQQYAPASSLTPKRIGDVNGWLAGRKVNYPFVYNSTNNDYPDYDENTGIWVKDFEDGDEVIITVMNNQFN